MELAYKGKQHYPTIHATGLAFFDKVILLVVFLRDPREYARDSHAMFKYPHRLREGVITMFPLGRGVVHLP